MGGGMSSSSSSLSQNDVRTAVEELYRVDPERARALVEAGKDALFAVSSKDENNEEVRVKTEDGRRPAMAAHGPRGSAGMPPDEGDTLQSKPPSSREQGVGGNSRSKTPRVYHRNLADVYESCRSALLGSGVSGTVSRVRHRKTNTTFAVKSIQLRADHRTNGSALEELKNEITIMAELDHPNIVRLYEAYFTDTHVHLVMELCSGGELYDRLIQDQRYDETIAADYIWKILIATRYLHDHGVVHRDIKLENVLFATPDGDLKLCDFGLSQHFKTGEHMRSMLGTPYYIAPEVLRQDYDERCDLWSIGVITFMLLSGVPPFPGSTNAQIIAAVARGVVDFDAEYWAGISDRAKDFVQTLLTVKVSERPTAVEALQHPWLEIRKKEPSPGEGSSADPSPHHLTLPEKVIDRLGKFRTFSKFKRKALEVVAFALAPEQLQDLGREFQKIDTENNGEISVKEFRQCLRSASLKEQDVDQIFASIDLDESGLIHWHEFLAAAVDYGAVDDEYLKIAFERLGGTEEGSISRRDLLPCDLPCPHPSTITPDRATDETWRDCALCACCDFGDGSEQLAFGEDEESEALPLANGVDDSHEDGRRHEDTDGLGDSISLRQFIGLCRGGGLEDRRTFRRNTSLMTSWGNDMRDSTASSWTQDFAFQSTGK